MNNRAFRSVPIKSSEITAREQFLSRRDFIRIATTAMGGALLSACIPEQTSIPKASLSTPSPGEKGLETSGVDELGSPWTPKEAATNYNNFYEFSTDKQGVAAQTAKFKVTPWTVEVSGLVEKPRTYGLEDLLKNFSQEDRVYRMRCVEGWSMVIPWQGFSLAKLLKEVQPTSAAQFVRFESVMRPEEMPGQKNPSYPWPYQEGLRLDEALNELTILATGIYGESLPVQSGAPVRLVVPWKYGFKSIKSVVKIELTDTMPSTLWNSIAPVEYGFYSNVNPNRPHPRWSQASERRIGEFSRRDTLMFNGYAEQVADLYKDMDLMSYF